MKMKTRKFVSMIVAFVMFLVCVVPVFAVESENSSGYAVNSNGETYGNYLEALEIGYEADLILAEGIDGTLGYVRASDLDDGADSLFEIVPQTENKIIPLYTENGRTIIGQFLIPSGSADTVQTRSTKTYSIINEMNLPGYTAYGKSGIESTDNEVIADTVVTTTETVAASHIGIQARCYRKSNGALVKSSSWKYNSNPTTEHSHSVSYNPLFNSNEFYSAGGVKLWNSEIGGYWSYYTFSSPSVQPGN